jgi:peptide/nickel transport system permease protein
MFFFIIRRFAASIPILWASSLLMFWLVTVSGDPLAALRQSTDPNREQTIAQLRQTLELDKPFLERYLSWLSGLASGDFGLNRDGQDVSVLLSQAAGTTFRLIILATVVSILIGIVVGVVTAVRQYSALDYGATFSAFLFFSLPVFWLAVLLKEFGAIRFNDYLEQPGLSTTGIVAIAALAAFLAFTLAGGSLRRQLGAAAATGVVSAIALAWMDRADWLTNPGLSPLALIIGGVVGAVAAAAVLAPLSERRVLISAVVAALICVALSMLLDTWVEELNWWRLVAAIVASLIIGNVVGALIGGEIMRQSARRAGGLAGFVALIVIGFDRFISAWAPGRTVATIGPKTPNLEASFWPTLVDYAGHQVLPTIALALIGLATFSRYTRASILETLNADYVRTAKAKGVPATQVIVRHAFRTAMIPVMTVVALSFATAIEGAVITERVFAWSGMGSLFIEGLQEVDPYPVMGFLVVVSVSIVFMNAVADLMYAYLDPRIRR